MRNQSDILLHGLLLGITLSLCNNSISAEQETSIPPATAASQTLPFNELRIFSEVFGRIKQDYVEPVSDKKLFADAIRGMLADLDPHSAYMSSEEYTEFQDVTNGQFVGLGIEIGMDNGYVRVVAPMDDSPAQTAGIQAGDLIIEFNDKPVTDMPPFEAIKLLHGELGSEIMLTVVREGEKEPLKFALTRKIIKTKSVKQRLLEKNYGYLRISSFQPGAGNKLIEAIEALKIANTGPLQGLVLDLRNNPGGLLNDAVEVSDAFLDSGLIVSTAGRIKDSEMRFNATPDDVLQAAPIVVLINAGTASAAEIVAGALQDNKRAIIMGEKSFGKGSVQAIMPTSDGAAIKLTIARYFTPSGRSIQAEGIEPDIKLAPGKLLTFAEADLTHRLPKAKSQNSQETKKNQTVDAEGGEGEAIYNTDYPLSAALNLLKGIVFQANTALPSHI